MHGLSDEEKWEAFVRCDASFDGTYCVAVKTTGIFCRPSCTARTPLRKNVVFYDTPEQAVADGFRPCKRCRPDLIEYRPLEELAEQVKVLLDINYSNREDMIERFNGLGVSFNHLSVIFKRQFGMTPFEYRNRLRARGAMRMLKETMLPVVDIACACGFESLSAFYNFFKKQTGMTPGEYRKSERDRADEKSVLL